jgi:glycerophosphoryl diester phosphodiesterase
MAHDSIPDAARSSSLLGLVVRRLPGDLRRALPTMIVYEVCFRTLMTSLAAPLVAWLVAMLVARSGSAAISNTAIFRFLLTPAGLAMAIVLAVSYLLGQLLLIAGLMAIAAMALRGQLLKIEQAMSVALRSSLRLLRLGLAQLLGIACVFAPFLGLAGLTYGVLLTSHDINYYLTEKPPAFLAAMGIGIVLGVILLVVVAAAYVRCVFVVPTVLFEGIPIRAAVHSSRERITGAVLPIAGSVLGWHAIVAIVGPILALTYVAIATRFLSMAGARVPVLIVLGVGILLLHGWLLAVLAFLQVSGASLLTVRLYDERSGGRAGAWADRLQNDPARAARVPRWAWALGVIALGLALVSTGAEVLGALRTIRPVSITAHRGASREAPENTLAALRKAIDRAVDYAEIDIHLTADGVSILLHDEDFQRLAGDPRRPGDLKLEQIRRLDVGSRFDRAFAGERIATLEEAIDLVQGRIKLNIELKPATADREPLARAVADLIRARQFEADCFVTSLDRQAVEDAHRCNPQLRTGAIISAAVGDIARLDVAVLSVRTGLVTEALLDDAHASRREVHAWTIDDPAVMARLIDRGVDGIITNEPGVARRVRSERQSLPTWQRLVLSLQSKLTGR